MEPLALTGNAKLIVAILLGFAIGFWLLRSDLVWRERALNALQLKDGLWLQTFLFSVAVGALIFYGGLHCGLLKVNVRPAYVWGSIIGGILAGAGAVLCGKVPITTVASLATGKLFSLWVILGFMAAFPTVKFLSKLLSATIYNWSQPIGRERVFNHVASLNAALVWTVVACLLLTLLLQVTIGNKDKKS